MAVKQPVPAGAPSDDLDVLAKMIALLETLPDAEAIGRVVFFLASKAGFTLTATANPTDEGA